MENRKNLWMGGLSIFACAACCSIPVLGSVAGVSFLTVAAGWLKSPALPLVVLAVALMFIRRRAKTTTRACDTDCNCKPKPRGAGQVSAD